MNPSSCLFQILLTFTEDGQSPVGSPSRRGRPPVIRAAERASRARAATSGGSGGPYGPPGSDPDSHLMDDPDEDEFVDDYYQDEDEDYYDEEDDYYEEGNEMMDDGEYPMCQVCPHQLFFPFATTYFTGGRKKSPHFINPAHQ